MTKQTGCGKRFEYGVGYAKCGFLPDILCPECLAYNKGFVKDRKEALEEWKKDLNMLQVVCNKDFGIGNKCYCIDCKTKRINSELKKLNEETE